MRIRALIASLAVAATGLVLTATPQTSAKPRPATEVCFGALKTVACVPPHL